MFCRYVIAALGREIYRPWAVHRRPYRRVRLLIRHRMHQRLVYLPELALVGHRPVAAPRQLDDVQRFLAHLLPCVEIQTPAHELVLMHPYAGGELRPASREVIEHRHVLREPHRVMERQLPDHRAQPQRLRVLGKRGQEDLRRGDRTDVGTLVLQRPVVAEPYALHQLRLTDMRVIDISSGLRMKNLIRLHLIPNGEFKSRHQHPLPEKMACPILPLSSLAYLIRPSYVRRASVGMAGAAPLLIK